MTNKTTSAAAKRPPRKAAATKAVASPAPANEFAASGAVIEPAIVDAVDMTHPAVDDNPRAATSADQNRIDFNDPTKPGSEVVAEQLAAQQA